MQQSAGGLEMKSARLLFFLASLPPPLLLTDDDDGGGEEVFLMFFFFFTPTQRQFIPQSCKLASWWTFQLLAGSNITWTSLRTPQGSATADSSSQVLFFIYFFFQLSLEVFFFFFWTSWRPTRSEAETTRCTCGGSRGAQSR